MRGFHGWIRLCLAAAAAGVLLALLISASAGAAGCLLVCPTTTPSVTTGPPTVGTPTVAGLTATTATATATVSPGGLDTTFRIAIPDPNDSEYPAFSFLGAPVPASSGPVADSAAMHLEPNTAYTIYGLATNSAGMTNGPETRFATPMLPAVPLTVTISSADVTIGKPVEFNPSTHGATYLTAPETLQQQYAGGRYRPISKTAPLDEYKQHQTLEAYPDRNAHYRVLYSGLDGSHRDRPSSLSNTVFVRVEPTHMLSISADPSQPDTIDVDETFTTHLVSTRFRGEPVYFYRSVSPHGPYQRFAVVRLRSEGRDLTAAAKLHTTVRVYIAACWRHQPLADMGKPFTFARCGAPNLG